jgi:hypothetical protein
MADINLPEQWIGFAHPAQHGHYSEPKCRRHCESPNRQQAESQAKRREQRGQNQHPITAADLGWAVRRLVDRDDPWSVCGHCFLSSSS